MIECVDTLGLCEAVVNVFLHVEAVHEYEIGRLRLFKELLLERVAVLSIVHDYFAVSCANEPLVVGFKE